MVEVKLEQVFLEKSGLEPEQDNDCVDLTKLYSLFPTYKATNELGRMEREAVDLLSDGLRSLGADEKDVQEVIQDEESVRFFATLAQMHIFQENSSHSG